MYFRVASAVTGHAHSLRRWVSCNFLQILNDVIVEPLLGKRIYISLVRLSWFDTLCGVCNPKKPRPTLILIIISVFWATFWKILTFSHKISILDCFCHIFTLYLWSFALYNHSLSYDNGDGGFGLVFFFFSCFYFIIFF